jgi:hypothetical protein
VAGLESESGAIDGLRLYLRVTGSLMVAYVA